MDEEAIEWTRAGLSLSPAGASIVVVAAILTLALPRVYALFPLLLVGCYIPIGQGVTVFGLNFPLFRILLLVGMLRLVARREWLGFELNKLDRIFVWWVGVSVVCGTLNNPGMDRLVNRLGFAYNALGTYFLFRPSVRDRDDIQRVINFMALMIVPLAIAMLVEKQTQRNVFAVFGGVPAITGAREGHLRCQGAFRTPILAGTFGATLAPLVIGLWVRGVAGRWRAAIGVICAAIITVAAASSGPLLALLCAFIAFALWPMRGQMRFVRWSLVILILGLAGAMKAPVWYLIAKVSNFTGGTGWHRAYLIDQAISHFGEWWLVGTPVTAHWAPAGQVLAIDPNSMDITNQFIKEGVQGGILELGLFMAIIVLCYKAVGRKVLALAPEEARLGLFTWSLGVALTAHCVSFISISYFDQIVVFWFFLIAAIACLDAGMAKGCLLSEPAPGLQSAVLAVEPESEPGPDRVWAAPGDLPKVAARNSSHPWPS